MFALSQIFTTAFISIEMERCSPNCRCTCVEKPFENGRPIYSPQTFIVEMTRNFRNYANQLRPHHHQITNIAQTTEPVRTTLSPESCSCSRSKTACACLKVRFVLGAFFVLIREPLRLLPVCFFRSDPKLPTCVIPKTRSEISRV